MQGIFPLNGLTQEESHSANGHESSAGRLNFPVTCLGAIWFLTEAPPSFTKHHCREPDRLPKTNTHTISNSVQTLFFFMSMKNH